MSNLVIFDIPHIKDSITHYLSQQDLAHCVLASKEWNVWFTPPLWRHPNFKTSSISLTSLTQRNNLHVHSLNNFTKELASITPTPSYPNLQSLSYTPNWTTSYDESIVLRFIKTLQSLQDLTLIISLSREGVHSELLDTIQALPRLKKIDLTCYHITSAVIIQQIIQTCSHYKALRLSIGGQVPSDHRLREGEEQELCNFAMTAMSRMEPTKIRELSITLSSEKQESAILPALLERCPLLESLRMEMVHHSKTLSQVSRVLESGKCPRLKFVRLGWVVSYGTKEEDILALLRVIGSRNTNDDDFGDNDDADDPENWGWKMNDTLLKRGGLESFAMDSTFPFNRVCVEALTHHHANTLTVLDLMNLRQIRIELVVGLVSGLPQLQSLMIAIWLKFKEDKGSPDTDTLLNTQWSCLGLKTLELGIQLSDDFTIEITHRSGNGSLADQCMGYLFSQIGRLTKLEEWELTTWIDLLSIESGYLSWLPQLKQLRGLNLKRYPNNMMGAVEAEWMMEHWTKLVHVTVYAGRGLRNLSDTEESPFFAAKRVFLAKKPWMQIDQ
ncbi:hypothetical protein BGX26_008973 [Mortierella sp. AD094]|nr:hypothetical protein BGX26_008973 [Mortierella sp. AD094]